MLVNVTHMLEAKSHVKFYTPVSSKGEENYVLLLGNEYTTQFYILLAFSRR